MKNQILGTFFYMLYIVAMLQPVMPLIEYNMNKEYIVSALCENRNKPELACNGKCYLDKKIENSHKNDSHNHSIPQIDMSKYPVSLVENLNFSINIKFNILNSEMFFEDEKQPVKYHSSVFKPPTVLI
ncbi:hypothetical protein [Urechidicola croceus]|uniref:Uncharacterized protein n=1 Tax=Urechidicola croceus TaxID=1850246 RepID=A0A1D8P6Q6_9FLAO|nr:hypothetical protein [Urechidicola croceus]AOW20242.1 hypothetical protein LPB138_05925 [Urechidicola croceus]